MAVIEDPFVAFAQEESKDEFARLASRDAAALRNSSPAPGTAAWPAVARLIGFDLSDRPLLSGISERPGEVLAGRSTVPLLRSMVGTEVVVLFERGDARKPIIVGVLDQGSLVNGPVDRAEGVLIRIDDKSHRIEAEHAIELRCGDASITLTRGGKVIIEGNYILSRSSGYNKIKGAAVDIN